MKLVTTFNNCLPWGNCSGNSPSNPHASTTGGETQKKEYAWAICKIPWPTSCRQRAIQPMAKIFYPYPRTGNLHQIYQKTCLQCWRWWYMSNLTCRKINHSLHHIRMRLSLYLQNIANAMIKFVNAFMFSCYWSIDLSRNTYHGTTTTSTSSWK